MMTAIYSASIARTVKTKLPGHIFVAGSMGLASLNLTHSFGILSHYAWITSVTDGQTDTGASAKGV